MVVDPDEFQRQRFRRETEVLLDPIERKLIEDDEFNTEIVLEDDPDPTRAEKLMQIARNFSHMATSPKAREKYLRIAAISGAVYTLWQVKKHWDRKRRD